MERGVPLISMVRPVTHGETTGGAGGMTDADALFEM